MWFYEEDYYCFKDFFNEHGSFVQRDVFAKEPDEYRAEKRASDEHRRIVESNLYEAGRIEIGIGRAASDEEILFIHEDRNKQPGIGSKTS